MNYIEHFKQLSPLTGVITQLILFVDWVPLKVSSFYHRTGKLSSGALGYM